MTTTGVFGADWRATVTPWGAVEPWDGSPRLDWWVAADDRWHVPSAEASIRQRRIDGTPVTETRLRVPSGDVVQRVYSVADLGGLTVMEVENDSTLPVAIAFHRADLLTSRAVATVPIEGIDLPVGAIVMPLGHKASVRVALSHAAPRTGPLPEDIPTAVQAARGWTVQCDHCSRLVLPDQTLADRVTTERCELALAGLDDPDEDPVAFLLGVHELTRWGSNPRPWVPEIAGAAERVARQVARGGMTWDADRALLAAEAVLRRADEPRAAADAAALRASGGPRRTQALMPPDGVRAVAWVEDLLARDGVLLPGGIDRQWLGAGIEAYGVPADGRRAVSFAVRWHGARPAVLWEVTGEAGLALRSGVDPSWTATDPSGEALWAAPPGALSDTAEPPSFS